MYANDGTRDSGCAYDGTKFVGEAGGKTERIRAERFWFNGYKGKRRIDDEVIDDAADRPEETGARVVLGKILDRPQKLGGYR